MLLHVYPPNSSFVPRLMGPATLPYKPCKSPRWDGLKVVS